ncbi:hypothetical protein OGAPHI_006083 [Ogataea philodendri]|uniref:Uncharacterized protein n=1 Tax=Ogataea philodendri TaxID=1378263 RepID=A0A9P8NZH5_9ASCO|nr:uncharacterized protein OGAPHI_006083 [Ogataea philodendri]KAH3661904.1 hypothetical protein OGAPHI_006083 [Ogataea philodendri]
MHHSDVQVSVPNPIDTILQILDRSQNYLCIEIVNQLGDQLGLNWKLLIQNCKVIFHLILISDDDSFTVGIVSGSSGSSQHLKNVLWREFNPSTFLWRVDIGTFDNNCVCWEINTPCQGGRRNQNFQISLSKQIFCCRSVLSVHSGMVNSKSHGEDTFQAFALCVVGFSPQNLLNTRRKFDKISSLFSFNQLVNHPFRSLFCFFSGMHKDDHLMAVGDVLHNFVVANFVHCLKPLQRLFLGDTNKLLGQRTWSVGSIEIEQSFFLNFKEPSHIHVIWKCSRQSNQSGGIFVIIV